MNYRTRTYVAGDWSNDKDAIDQLTNWNESDHWSLSFSDAHEFTQARDSSLKCSIKRSLKERLDISKTFVLIVGNTTDNVTAGSCQFCDNYNSFFELCKKGYSVDFRSYIKFECEEAVKADMKIVVLYNSSKVEKSKCPDSVRNLGTHVAMKDIFGKYDYYAVKEALEN